MSELINNRELRQKAIKDIIKQLHEGKTADEVKNQFEEAFEGVSASEISEAEGALIAEGLPVEEIQKLCDVHASVFKGSIEEIHQPADPSLIPGHPLNVLKLENREIERIIKDEIRSKLNLIHSEAGISEICSGIESLGKIGIHYQKKENLLFPYMEKYGITAPPKVMWGVDDEIRAAIKEARGLFEGGSRDAEQAAAKLEEALTKVEEMIFKEENIMIPMLMENLTQDEWKIIADESGEIGYLIENIPVWNPAPNADFTQAETIEAKEAPGFIKLPSGIFNTEELTCMLNTLPFDITYVNKDDVVKYFSEGKERAFPRTKAIIGRNVSNCHPPASVHVVEHIVEDFKAGRKDQEDFWIHAGEKYILIRYYAVRNEKGEYLGVLEVTQDIRPIQGITGEKRLLSE
ncbi:DUF438 domain-containing protein [Anaerobium acetethylicum]|uniref:PAC domain-containing protein n=1 Tax=Anaerobium acetethylicum TaxID=1619234 RepID=A0A1D3TSU8_9FIRM|nr:DUF438 domain-containing protein [Anaerobium acetethylicum]SCP96952.1 hypothetical protein SAMN05421730_100765 [Anaerobium acetethylicum]